MRPEAARLKRLSRLERIRAIAKQDALRAAAEAERHLAQVNALADRTARIAADYRARRDCDSGTELRCLQQFSGGIAAIISATARDAAAAQSLADQRQCELASAERSRAAAEDQLHAEVRAQTRRGKLPALTGRKAIGTELEQ